MEGGGGRVTEPLLKVIKINILFDKSLEGPTARLTLEIVTSATKYFMKQNYKDKSAKSGRANARNPIKMLIWLNLISYF